MNVTLYDPSLFVDDGEHRAPQEMLTLQRLGPSSSIKNAEKVQGLPIILCV